MMNIREEDLQNLIERRAAYIGFSWKVEAANMAGSVGLLLTAYQMEPGALRAIALAASMALTAVNGKGMWSAMKDKYTPEKLQKEIQSLDMVPHKYSLIAIKDTFNEYPNRFLLYYDKGWGCHFLLNYKTRAAGNDQALKESLSHDLKISAGDISLKKLAVNTYQKFSAEAGLKKNYEHTLYLAEIHHFPEVMTADRFEIGDKSFVWMTIDAMRQDAEIQKKNMDVVEMIRANVT